MLTEVFKQVVALSLMGSGWAIVILLTKALFNRKLGANWHYFFWFLLIIRLLVPYTPESSFSILKVFPQVQQAVHIPQTSGSPVENLADWSPIGQISQTQLEPNNGTNPSSSPQIIEQTLSLHTLAIVWITGCFFMALYIFIVNARLYWRLRHQPVLDNPDILPIVEECKTRLHVGSKVSVVEDTNLKSPALFGLFKPKILLSQELAGQLSPDELRYIFLHELAHLKRKDLWVSVCALLIQIVYWFNPLIWYSLYRMKQDCEIACDATALRAISPEENRPYAQTIINLLQLLSKPHWTPGTLGFASKFNSRRIIMISAWKKGSVKWTIVALCITLLVGCSSLTTPPKTSENPPSQSGTVTPGQQNSGQDSSSTTPGNSDSGTSTSPGATNPTPAPAPNDAQRTLLNTIMQLGKQGKVLNCGFAAKTTNIGTIIDKWGNPDKTDWVAAAKGRYATYSKHGAVFGINKGEQIFEVRTFDKQLSQLTLAKVKQVFGTPPYDVKSKGEEIIGYVASSEFKLLLVFPQPTSSNPNPTLDHYSVLYPQGTVNSMAGDPGRQW